MISILLAALVAGSLPPEIEPCIVAARANSGVAEACARKSLAFLAVPSQCLELRDMAPQFAGQMDSSAGLKAEFDRRVSSCSAAYVANPVAPPPKGGAQRLWD